MTNEMKEAIARVDDQIDSVLQRPNMHAVFNLQELQNLLWHMLYMRTAFLDVDLDLFQHLRELACERKVFSSGALGPTSKFNKDTSLFDPKGINFYTEWVRRARQSMDKDHA